MGPSGRAFVCVCVCFPMKVSVCCIYWCSHCVLRGKTLLYVRKNNSPRECHYSEIKPAAESLLSEPARHSCTRLCCFSRCLCGFHHVFSTLLQCTHEHADLFPISPVNIHTEQSCYRNMPLALLIWLYALRVHMHLHVTYHIIRACYTGCVCAAVALPVAPVHSVQCAALFALYAQMMCLKNTDSDLACLQANVGTHPRREKQRNKFINLSSTYVLSCQQAHIRPLLHITHAHTFIHFATAKG